MYGRIKNYKLFIIPHHYNIYSICNILYSIYILLNLAHIKYLLSFKKLMENAMLKAHC